jgi:hypothetical protein
MRHAGFSQQTRWQTREYVEKKKQGQSPLFLINFQMYSEA